MLPAWIIYVYFVPIHPNVKPGQKKIKNAKEV